MQTADPRRNWPAPTVPATAGRGFSLVELLLVVSLLGILAGIALSSLDSGIQQQLQAAAQIVAADIAAARDLAVSNNSSYAITFDPDNDRYVLQHSGTNPALDTLPDTPFRDPSDSPDQQTTDLADLPLGGSSIELVAVHDLTPAAVPVLELEFGPLGESSRAYETQVWLAAGQSDARRYVSVRIDPVTGLAAIGPLQTAAPTPP